MKVDLMKMTQKILYGEVQEAEPSEEQVEEVDTTKKVSKRKKRIKVVEQPLVEQKVEKNEEVVTGPETPESADNQLPAQSEDKPLG